MNISDEAIEAMKAVFGGKPPRGMRAALAAAAPHLMAQAANELRELPLEELQSQVVPRDWPESLNVHNVINDVADWVERRSSGAGE